MFALGVDPFALPFPAHAQLALPVDAAPNVALAPPLHQLSGIGDCGKDAFRRCGDVNGADNCVLIRGYGNIDHAHLLIRHGSMVECARFLWLGLDCSWSACTSALR